MFTRGRVDGYLIYIGLPGSATGSNFFRGTGRWGSGLGFFWGQFAAHEFCPSRFGSQILFPTNDWTPQWKRRFSDSWNFVEIDEIDDLRGNSLTIELSRYGFNEIMCGDVSSSRILNQLGDGFKEFYFSSRFLGRWSNVTDAHIFQMGGSTY